MSSDDDDTGVPAFFSILSIVLVLLAFVLDESWLYLPALLALALALAFRAVNR